MANDADPGVRRELILALRWLAVGEVADALTTLIRGWDGQDRWYLEALGLALDEPRGAVPDRPLRAGTVRPDRRGARPRRRERPGGGPSLLPRRPERVVHRHWHARPVCLRSLEAHRPCLAAPSPGGPLCPQAGQSHLVAPELQQAWDDTLSRIDDQAAAAVLADLAATTPDPGRRAGLSSTIARKLGGTWREARDDGPVIALVRVEPRRTRRPAWRGSTWPWRATTRGTARP